MAGVGVEMIVGARHDPQFGPVVVVGAGGIHVELLRDVRMALAPVSHRRAHELVGDLAIASILAGARGAPAVDVAALADAVVRVSWLAARLGPWLVELDINPLLVTPRGVLALDARATLAAPHGQDTSP
jgi:acetyl-CoA synthetase (ADP-forming)